MAMDANSMMEAGGIRQIHARDLQPKVGQAWANLPASAFKEVISGLPAGKGFEAMRDCIKSRKAIASQEKSRRD
jgi:hypothetical protein